MRKINVAGYEGQCAGTAEATAPRQGKRPKATKRSRITKNRSVGANGPSGATHRGSDSLDTYDK